MEKIQASHYSNFTNINFKEERYIDGSISGGLLVIRTGVWKRIPDMFMK